MNWSLVIPAAGSGSRFGGDTPKQFLPLKGRPLICHTIERFLGELDLQEIVVAIAPDRLAWFDAIVKGFEWGARVRTAVGGETRQHSVQNALAVLRQTSGLIVAVHDAVRPFFQSRMLQTLLKGAEHVGASLPGAPLKDTIHRVADRMIVDTPDREQFVAAQTPQCFRFEILTEILDRAAREGVNATDEAGLAARYGHPVRVIEGDAANFKITTPEDFIMAEATFDTWRVR